MVADLSLFDLMIKNPITVHPDDDIEIAAQLIYKHKIGGMPVVKKGIVLGIITANDLLRSFIDMMGILTATSRIDVVIGDRRKSFQRVMTIINDCGGDIISVAMTAQPDRTRNYYFRLSSCETAPIKNALEKEGFEVLEAMD
jgi:acetoin utilization protein AcuB